MPFPLAWMDELLADHSGVTLRTLALDTPGQPSGTPSEALELFSVAICLACRAGSLHAHISSKLGEPCDPRVAAFLSTRQTTNTTPPSEGGTPVTR